MLKCRNVEDVSTILRSVLLLYNPVCSMLIAERNVEKCATVVFAARAVNKL